MGAAALKQPGSLRASDAWGSEHATRSEATHARRSGWRGRRGERALASGSEGWDAAQRGRRARGAALLTRPWHTEQTRGGRSGGAGIAGTDPTARSYRLTRWRRRPHTSPARDAHWLPPQPGGVASPACPRQGLPLARMLLGGRNADRQGKATGLNCGQSRGKTETACGGGGQRERVGARDSV